MYLTFLLLSVDCQGLWSETCSNESQFGPWVGTVFSMSPIFAMGQGFQVEGSQMFATNDPGKVRGASCSWAK